MIYDVTKYGAVGDGKTSDTKAIQQAIDDCSKAGGGRVLVPGGHVYRTGTLVLKSNVELHLELGAVIKASDNMEDFDLFGRNVPKHDGLDRPTYENCDYAGAPTLYFIYANDADNISITGLGAIDGNEEIFYGTVTKWHIDGSFYPRVPLLFIENVRHLNILNVTLQNSAFWTTHLVGCQDVLIEGIHILNNLTMANCDGIDPDHCQNVRIANCHIQCADDCIVFKNTGAAKKYGHCENIVVTNCTLISTSAAIKFGTESEELFRNIVVSNCAISRTNRAISLQLRDDGSIENVLFSNINIDTRMFSGQHWWGKAEPIAITAQRRYADTQVGHIKNVKFENINCDSENGILIYGDEDVNIDNITFENISLDISKKTDWPKNIRDIRPTYKDDVQEVRLNPFFAKNAKRIKIKNLEVTVSEDMKAYMGNEIEIENADVKVE